MDNISYCRYLTDTSGTWNSDHYRVRNIVRSIKGEDFEGYASIEVGGVSRRLSKANPHIAFDWFADQVLANTKFGEGLYYICPIPDSQRIVGATHASRTLRLAETLSARLPSKLRIWDHLRFRRAMERKSRNEQRLFENMVCTESKAPKGFLILLDDVCTTGAHARAARRRLVEHGARDICAMSVARTMSRNNEMVFGFRADPL